MGNAYRCAPVALLILISHLWIMSGITYLLFYSWRQRPLLTILISYLLCLVTIHNIAPDAPLTRAVMLVLPPAMGALSLVLRPLAHPPCIRHFSLGADNLVMGWHKAAFSQIIHMRQLVANRRNNRLAPMLRVDWLSAKGKRNCHYLQFEDQAECSAFFQQLCARLAQQHAPDMTEIDDQSWSLDPSLWRDQWRGKFTLPLEGTEKRAFVSCRNIRVFALGLALLAILILVLPLALVVPLALIKHGFVFTTLAPSPPALPFGVNDIPLHLWSSSAILLGLGGIRVLDTNLCISSLTIQNHDDKVMISPIEPPYQLSASTRYDYYHGLSLYADMPIDLSLVNRIEMADRGALILHLRSESAINLSCHTSCRKAVLHELVPFIKTCRNGDAVAITQGDKP